MARVIALLFALVASSNALGHPKLWTRPAVKQQPAPSTLAALDIRGGADLGPVTAAHAVTARYGRLIRARARALSVNLSHTHTHSYTHTHNTHTHSCVFGAAYFAQMFFMTEAAGKQYWGDAHQPGNVQVRAVLLSRRPPYAELLYDGFLLTYLLTYLLTKA